MPLHTPELESAEEMSSEQADAAPGYIEMIETVISSLEKEGSAMVSHAQEGYLWKFCYGQVEVFVQLTGLTDDDTLTVWAGLLEMPSPVPASLLQRLLELNWTTTLEARFALLNDKIVVVSSRTLAELSAGETSRAITIVASLADEYQASLKAELGG